MISLIVHLETILNVSNFNTELFIQISPCMYVHVFCDKDHLYFIWNYISIYLMDVRM
jgi:hypothetical protein